MVTRKSLLYRTNVEYGDYTLNHVLGCSHGCLYPCYAMMLKKRFGDIKNYEDWIQPKLVENYHELLLEELPKLKNKINSIHLCFTTDPFMYKHSNIIEASEEILRLIAKYNIHATVLTKGLYPDSLKNLPNTFSFGITLISTNENFRKRMEPGAASYKERIKSLKKMHDFGFNTWVSIEPYPTPNIIEQNLGNILDQISFVDKIIFGRLNYNKKVKEYNHYQAFYDDCAKKVASFCDNKKIDYHIKKGTSTIDFGV
ncbi:MAG: radical SAM protein [bacterium]